MISAIVLMMMIRQREEKITKYKSKEMKRNKRKKEKKNHPDAEKKIWKSIFIWSVYKSECVYLPVCVHILP